MIPAKVEDSSALALQGLRIADCGNNLDELFTGGVASGIKVA